jgi:hypothetical protein
MTKYQPRLLGLQGYKPVKVCPTGFAERGGLRHNGAKSIVYGQLVANPRSIATPPAAFTPDSATIPT